MLSRTPAPDQLGLWATDDSPVADLLAAPDAHGPTDPAGMEQPSMFESTVTDPPAAEQPFEACDECGLDIWQLHCDLCGDCYCDDGDACSAETHDPEE